MKNHKVNISSHVFFFIGMNNSCLLRKLRGRPTQHSGNYVNTKEVLIHRGIELLTEHGMNTLSLDNLMKFVQVPNKSFYHYLVKRLRQFLTQTDLS